MNPIGDFIGQPGNSNGLGSIEPSSDNDYWSFQALAGDIVSLSVDTPDSDLVPRVYLYDPSGSSLTYDYYSGPGSDAFISHYSITTNGTYYVRVISYYSTTGSYQLRIDLARGIQLESDPNYTNDSIAGANSLTLTTEGDRRYGTIAGTIMTADM